MNALIYIVRFDITQNGVNIMKKHQIAKMNENKLLVIYVNETHFHVTFVTFIMQLNL